ncbi:hypothetical protein K7887_21955 (plasmid) [Sutcliffiella horikoshii]|uniref:hypothetical protein n=1 Tax=Sutcliffiella horikoshii TaxID=79883 RepID=UPI001CBBCC34|nr:hypothetical protein [Sutcliffiella horikoshii]UAL49714.1 hypothetical protein K7887_21955 [Sutcliffiella horikoshii]
MICSYCETENKEVASHCDFCGAPLKKQRPRMKEFLYLDQCELPFRELSSFHTYDLLILLRLVREERTKAYNLMRSLLKAPEGVLIDSETLIFSESEYRRYTARMKVIEGILVDRMGYKPKRVDDKLLMSLQVKMEKAKRKQ